MILICILHVKRNFKLFLLDFDWSTTAKIEIKEKLQDFIILTQRNTDFAVGSGSLEISMVP